MMDFYDKDLFTIERYFSPSEIEIILYRLWFCVIHLSNEVLWTEECEQIDRAIEFFDEYYPHMKFRFCKLKSVWHLTKQHLFPIE